MRTWRYLIALPGALLLAFGVYRLFTQTPGANLLAIGRWLIAAIVLHDLILSPVVVAIGWALSRTVPPRARRFVQAGLISGGLVTVVAAPLIYRRGSQPRSKAWLLQNYGAHLAVLLLTIATVCLIAYAVQVAADRNHSSIKE